MCPFDSLPILRTGGIGNENSMYSNFLLNVLLATEEDEYQGVICQPYNKGPRANGNDV